MSISPSDRAGRIKSSPLPGREEFPRARRLGVSAKAGLSLLRHWRALVVLRRERKVTERNPADKGAAPRSPVGGIKSQREEQAGKKKGPGMARALRHKSKLLFSLTGYDLP